MIKNYINILLCLSLTILLAGCGNNEADMTPQEIAESHETEDLEKIKEASQNIKKGELGDKNSHSDALIDLFERTTDNHIITNQVADKMVDVSLKAINQDLKEKNMHSTSLYLYETTILYHLKLMRAEDETLKEVHTAFTDDLRKKYFQGIEKIDEKYPEYKETKENMPVPEIHQENY